MAALLEPGLESAHLVLLGYGELRDTFIQASVDPRWRGRVHVLDPVSTTDLLMWVASADIGVMPIQPTTLNHRLSTPNKLFECLMAGIPVVASDFPDIRRTVVEDPAGSLGIVCDPEDVTAIATSIRSILDLPEVELVAMGARCRQAAADRWNWDREGAVLIASYPTTTRRSAAQSAERTARE